jgi:predicted Rossmann fold nucleotide-binding protein DprA/Smf involved in DNA uptake
MKALYGVRRIISGGQTGVDRAALDFAIENGLSTGGYVPFGRIAEDGRISEQYPNLIETETENPAIRTELNVLSSNATLILSHGKLTGGSLLTKQLAERHKRPFLHIDLSAESINAAVERAKRWLTSSEYPTINMAGPRLSEDSHIYNTVKEFLERLAADQNKERGS